MSDTKITWTATELTHAVKELKKAVKSCSVASLPTESIRSDHTLSVSSSEIPVATLLGTIVIVPEGALPDVRYTLPAPKALISAARGKGYDIDIRNDSKQSVTILSAITGAISGPDTIEAGSGSRWHLKIEGDGYRLIRLT